jgi:hypothetical protein
VTGATNSVNFPIQGAFKLTPDGYDTFVTKVSPDAVGTSSLIYSTFLGGAGLDYGYDIAVDLEGRAFVVGTTQSNDFQITDCAFPKGPSWDGFIAVLNPLGSNITFLTYLDGNSSDSINAIAVDVSGTAHVTGSTYSTNLRVNNAYQGNLAGSKDAFVTRIIPSGCAP